MRLIIPVLSIHARGLLAIFDTSRSLARSGSYALTYPIRSSTAFNHELTTGKRLGSDRDLLQGSPHFERHRISGAWAA